ncbi:MBL fold metallo-hydrolase [Shewanella intestini]|uniref:MBL fold metallo-hydrolase n=1 Tax=Shewanella intestini TaxID=2017544 RepID=A0ABS5HYS2_9GAMM|nr:MULTISPECIES: MBL fold metallo-hydrolase [Shewanella]MBR9726924.1 MBL fold metallo-hydrolase [Shewanella intestini]MRG34510.1 MBL fold metallo-hydrolase [Shewanella sp. XMDDZSB0408]
MKYQIIPVTPFQQNCSVIWCKETLEAAVIDPGGDKDRIMTEVKKLGLTLTKILLTHGHIDHVGAAQALAQQVNIPIIGPHKEDKFWLDSLPSQSKNFGFPEVAPFMPQQYLQDGESVVVGKQTLQVLHCPGHTPGHVIFYHQAMKMAWVGDVLFRSSIGRTDFPKSNHDDLIHSITQKLWPLGNDTQFIPGHGPMSTFAEERLHNPFVADELLD